MGMDESSKTARKKAMSKKITRAAFLDFSQRIGRRVRLQDLHVLMTVAQAGSMGKAAQKLNTTQPAVSRAIAELEAAIGVRLLDRGQQGVEPTVYGRAFLHCAAAVFDDLRQGVRNIEFLSDPTLGEIRIGGNETVIAGLLSTVVGRLRRRYPGITVHMTHVGPLTDQCRELRERKLDLVFGQLEAKIALESDIETETLYQDHICVVAGSHNRWSTRRKMTLAELADEPWGLPPSDSATGSLVWEAFRLSGVSLRAAATGSPYLLLSMLSKGPFLVTIPSSILKFGAALPPLNVLPVELPVPPWPVGFMTLKNRAISPVAQLFLDSAREVVKPAQDGKRTATSTA
jgi:DNA-binding transcriptional LysR family regulator